MWRTETDRRGDANGIFECRYTDKRTSLFSFALARRSKWQQESRSAPTGVTKLCVVMLAAYLPSVLRFDHRDPAAHRE